MAKAKPISGPHQKQGQSSPWTAGQAYTLALACLVAGLVLGYLFHGSGNDGLQPVQAAATKPAGTNTFSQDQLVDKQAELLIAKLKENPTDSGTMVQIGNIYYDAKLFQKAIGYYEDSLKLNASDPNVISDLGTSYFYSGNSDQALKELNRALQVRTNFGPALFNIGIVKWEGKKDAKGALEAWQLLLKTNPAYQDRQHVEQLIAEVQQNSGISSLK